MPLIAVTCLDREGGCGCTPPTDGSSAQKGSAGCRWGSGVCAWMCSGLFWWGVGVAVSKFVANNEGGLGHRSGMGGSAPSVSTTTKRSVPRHLGAVPPLAQGGELSLYGVSRTLDRHLAPSMWGTAAEGG